MFNEELENKLSRIVKGDHTPEEKKSIKSIRNIDLERNWGHLKKSIESKHGDTLSLKPGKQIYFIRVAAAVLVLFLASAVIYTFTFRHSNEIQQVSSGQENTEILLADGSKIIMNKGSFISYPGKMDRRKREVILSGEAWFEVTKTDKFPFYIYLENSTVKVLGTSFNIKEEENGNVIVSVVSGNVQLYEKENENNTMMLRAGQQGIFNAMSRELEFVPGFSENTLYWRTGHLSFRDELLQDVFNELETHFDIKIVTKDYKILRYRLTTNCEGQALEDIMQELSLLYDLKYYAQSDTVYVE